MSARCTLCGEPMPPGEEMFKYHGYSGPCPKPALPQPKLMAIIEYLHRQDALGFWIDVLADRQPHASLGPFGSEEERQRAHDDILIMVRAFGGKDMSRLPQ